MMFENLLQDDRLIRLIGDQPINIIDIGSRGGIEEDLLPIAWAVSAWGFEPDTEAYRRLLRKDNGPWREVTHIPEALSGSAGERTLSIPRSPEGASILSHNKSIGERFAYSDLFEVRRKSTVCTTTLDEACSNHQIPAPSFIKLDVEGAELEILQGAKDTLSRVVALKIEVAFIEQRINQPLIWDIQEYLHEAGFEIVAIMHPHSWRMNSTTASPYVGKSVIPFSRGQIAQADLLVFRRLNHTSSQAARNWLQDCHLAMIAMSFGYFDHAHEILSRTDVKERAESLMGESVDTVLNQLSRKYGRRIVIKTGYRRLRSAIALTKSFLRTLN